MKSNRFYYGIQTEENKEIYVKNRLTTLISGLDVIVPIKKIRYRADSISLFGYERILEGYVLIGKNHLTEDDINGVNSVKYVRSMLPISEAGVPLPLGKDEVKRFIKRNEKNDFSVLASGDVHIINGQYNGYTATVNKYQEDTIWVTVNISKRPRVKLPIWSLAKRV